MDEQTNALLRDLAAKLGTTIEHLWIVLLNQAKVELIKDVVTIIFSVLFIAFTIIRHIRLQKKDGYTDKSDHYGMGKDSVVLPMIIAAILSVVFIIMTIICIMDVIDISFNPEYWALKEVTHALK